jgi:predicted nucleic acid-binding protein
VSALVVVDSDILIDAARGIDEAVDCLDTLEQRSTLVVSSITEMELVVGCRNKTELRNLERFLRRFSTIRVSETVCDAAVDLLRQYRLSHGLAIPDALIAATAIAQNEPLITKNQRDYRFIKGLRLLPYP